MSLVSGKECAAPTPSWLKAYLVLALDWQSPMLEAAWLATADPEFQKLARAGELRRQVLVPLFRDWIPPDSSAELLTGTGLAKFDIVRAGVCISYHVECRGPFDFAVQRKVSIAIQRVRNSEPVYKGGDFRREWTKCLKIDASSHYTVERIISELGVPYQRVWASGAPDRVGLNLIDREVAPGNWSLRVNIHFHDLWTRIEIARASNAVRKREWAIIAKTDGVSFHSARKGRTERIFAPNSFQSHKFVLDRIKRRQAALERKPAEVNIV